MKIVNQNNTTHEIKLIPRFYPTNELVLELKNESTQVKTVVDNSYTISDGYLTLTFDFTFQNKDRFEFKLTENEIVFRGKIYATSEDTQDYKQTNGVYTYEF